MTDWHNNNKGERKRERERERQKAAKREREREREGENHTEMKLRGGSQSNSCTRTGQVCADRSCSGLSASLFHG